MQIDVTSAAVVRGEMEHDVHSGHDLARHTGLTEVGVHKVHFACIDARPDVLQLAAAQVVHDMDLGAALHERFHQVGADERRPTRNQYPSAAPDHVYLPLWSPVRGVRGGTRCNTLKQHLVLACHHLL